MISNKFLLGHRGYSEVAPENTKLAFEVARIFGFDGVEIDVHKTKDNKLVVIHDETVNRTSNAKGKVCELTLEELEKIDFGAKFQKNLPFQKILTYEEFLKLFGNVFEIINVEIKTNVNHYKGIEKLIWNVHQKVKPKAKIIYSSFNFESLKILNKISSKAIMGFLFVDANEIKGKQEEISKICKYIHPYFKSVVNPKDLAIYKEMGLKINTWTIDKRKTRNLQKVLSKLLENDLVESIISNSKF